MRLEEVVAAVGMAALIAYALLGGADFGGGIWDMLARGRTAAAQREGIYHAMGPVWEANHVWLILLIVLLFSCFPPAFAALSVAFFVPFHLVLLGIVLRGSAFVFRSHAGDGAHSRIWTHAFGIASSLTPLVLGMCLGAVSSGKFTGGAAGTGAWLSPFGWSLGVLALSVCAYVAAVYLTLESDGEVREAFRRKTLVAGALMTAAALGVLLVARWDAPRFWDAMIQPRSVPIFAVAALAAAVSALSVHARRYTLGRIASCVLVALLVAGWGMAQHPYLIFPTWTLAAAASPEPTLRFVLWTLLPGGGLLLPSLWLLFAVFKRRSGSKPAPTSPRP